METIVNNTNHYLFGKWAVLKKEYTTTPGFEENIKSLGLETSQFNGDEDLLFLLNNGIDAVYLLKKYKNIYVLKTLLSNDTDYVSHYFNILYFYNMQIHKPDPTPELAKRSPITFMIYIPVHIARNVLEIFPQWTNNGKVSKDIFDTPSRYPMYELEREGMTNEGHNIAGYIEAFKSEKVDPIGQPPSQTPAFSAPTPLSSQPTFTTPQPQTAFTTPQPQPQPQTAFTTPQPQPQPQPQTAFTAPQTKPSFTSPFGQSQSTFSSPFATSVGQSQSTFSSPFSQGQTSIFKPPTFNGSFSSPR